MITWEEVFKELEKDPAFKREYDALEDWYQEELARQRALDAADEGAARPVVENTESLTACV